MKQTKKPKLRSIRFAPEIDRKINALAAKERRSLTAQVEVLVREALAARGKA